jgi:hypothetical protein
MHGDYSDAYGARKYCGVATAPHVGRDYCPQGKETFLWNRGSEAGENPFRGDRIRDLSAAS